MAREKEPDEVKTAELNNSKPISAHGFEPFGQLQILNKILPATPVDPDELSQ